MAKPMKINSLAYKNGEYCAGESFQQFFNKREGIFETMKSQAGAILGLDYHLERFAKGALASSLKSPPLELLRGKVLELVSAYQNDALVRLVLCGEDWYLFGEVWVDVWDGKSAVSLLPVVAERANPEVKSLLAPVCMEARSRAEAAGYEEALLVDRFGNVSEGAWSNAFFVDEAGVLVTPAHGILPGVTRRLVLELAKGVCPVSEREFPLSEMLSDASEVFITQATRGIVPVERIDERVFNNERKITSLLQAALAGMKSAK